jgi:hypothetical protein
MFSAVLPQNLNSLSENHRENLDKREVGLRVLFDFLIFDQGGSF